MACRMHTGQMLSSNILSESSNNSNHPESYLLITCKYCLKFLMISTSYDSIYLDYQNQSQMESACDMPNDNIVVDDCVSRVSECCRNSKLCCEKQLTMSNTNVSGTNMCPVTWDGFSCVNATEPGTSATFQCPSFILNFVNAPRASKLCQSDGQWEKKEADGVVWEPTYYDECFMIDNAIIISYLSITILVISIIFLVISIGIFVAFRGLRRQHRIQMHTNLFFALLFKSICELITTLILNVHTYQLVRSGGSSLNESTSLLLYSNSTSCNWITICQRYFQNCSFYWMLCEALFLYHLLFRAFEQISNIKPYLLVGWGVPLLYTSLYVVIRWFHPSLEYMNNKCWVDELPRMDYMIKVPNIIALCINLILLIHIIRLIRNIPTHHTDSGWRNTLKSVIVLVPLFGLHLLLVAVRMEESSSFYLTYSLCQHIIQDSQGITVSLAFCAFNLEVRNTIREKWRVISILHQNNYLPNVHQQHNHSDHSAVRHNGSQTGRRSRSSNTSHLRPLITKSSTPRHTSSIIDHIVIKPETQPKQ